MVLFGAGKRGRRLCKTAKVLGIEIVAVVDNNSASWGKTLEGYEIQSPEKLLELQGVNWCITVLDANAAQQIREKIQQTYHYELEKEVSYYSVILDGYRENQEIRQKILERKIEGCKNKKRSIIFVCGNGLVLGGLEAWAISISEALIESGEKNTYILANSGDYDVPAMLVNHIIYVNINRQERFSMESVCNLVEAIMDKLPCKVITTYTDDIMLAAYVVKCYYPEMIEIIATIHSGCELTYNDYFDFRKCPDIFIGVSEDIREGLIQKGIKSEIIYTMSIPFDCKKTLVRTYTEDNEMPIRIGYAGRMEYTQKRMDLFLKLMSTLEKKDVHYIMELAGGGNARQEMEEFVHLNNLDNKVKFVGKLERSQIPSFWREQDICINLADYEGRSISITEAMGNGAVPIVTATSGVKEDITNDINGYIVPLEDYRSMADYIEYLANHRERLKEMGELAHKAVYPKSLMRNHLEFWRDIISQRYNV